MAEVNFKKFLKFYGSHPENFDQETRERIASTPADKLRRDLQAYRAAVGVDFYNLNLGGALQPAEGGYCISSEGRKAQAGVKAMRKFYLKYMGRPMILLDRDGTERQSTGIEESQLISVMIFEPQPVYRAIVDKAIAGEAMTDDEIAHINQALAGGSVYQQYSEEKQRHILRRRVYFGPFGIIKALYEFLLDISSQRVEIRRCAADDCNNIYVPYKSGREQQFCSDRCYKRVYMRERRRKREKAVV